MKRHLLIDMGAAAPRVKCGAKGHEWSSRTDWGEK